MAPRLTTASAVPRLPGGQAERVLGGGAHRGEAPTGASPPTIDEGGQPATGTGGAAGFNSPASWQGSIVDPTAPTAGGASRPPG
ncbi:hypothetical protein JOF41_001439 [Saccharothrix coeruleofusca]|uniref:hypothetical protein n=1 Tax=Saccharothrix coeruleofusca TaxID=33919 RepID=UPI001AEA3D40|nr:hypothetical protein [Saccharothrix coeruleofusca]MBP2335261.1 hypothetical protein [Saccharothrix coeruleofusca]